MNIEIICVGKLKEKYWVAAVDEYKKRLRRFCKVTITEVPEEKLPAHAGTHEEQEVVVAEGKNIIKKVSKSSNSYLIVLDISGKQLSSTEMAKTFATLNVKGKSNLIFVIGGSLGLSAELLALADYRLSFSKMTFTHQMMRPILIEQIYRAFKINANETYHK